jgi:hypothetical protein
MEDWVGRIFVGVLVLIMGLLIFSIADEDLGTKQTYRENLTVTDVYDKHVMCGKTIITKYYITVKTETGTEDISVSHDIYKKVEVNNDIEVTITITETKITKQTIIDYSVD